MDSAGRDGIFTALADSSDCISIASLVKFYSYEHVDVDIDPYWIRAPMSQKEAMKAINTFKDLMHYHPPGQNDNVPSECHGTAGIAVLDQLHFQRGLDNIMNMIDYHDDKQLIMAETESYCAQYIEESPHDAVVALLGLPSEISSSELKSFLK